MNKIERFTDRANKVMELALREALGMGHSYVGTEHVLLGLVREGEGVAAQVLVGDLGLDLGVVRKAVIERLSGYQSEETKMRNAIRRRGIDIGNQVTGDELRKIAVVLGWAPDDTDPIAERLERIPSHTSPTTDGFTFVQIDRVPYRVKVGDYTGAQIRRFAAPPIADDRDLWMQEPFGENDLLIRDDDTVALGPTTGTRMWTHPRFINGG